LKDQLLDKKNWSSLTQVRDFIIENMPEVKIYDFWGYKLETSLGIITLTPEGLKINEL